MSDGNVTGSDNAIGWFIIMAIAVICFIVFWHYFQYDVRSVFRWMRYGEMWLVDWFVSDSYVVPWGDNFLNHKQWFDGIPSLTKEQINGDISSKIAIFFI